MNSILNLINFQKNYKNWIYMIMRISKIVLCCLIMTITMFTSGCISISSWGLKQDRQEIKREISRKEGELDRHTRAFVSGTRRCSFTIRQQIKRRPCGT